MAEAKKDDSGSSSSDNSDEEAAKKDRAKRERKKEERQKKKREKKRRKKGRYTYDVHKSFGIFWTPCQKFMYRVTCEVGNDILMTLIWLFGCLPFCQS